MNLNIMIKPSMTMLIKSTLLAAFLLTANIGFNDVHAGNNGATSTGSLEIGLTIPDKIQITGFSDHVTSITSDNIGNDIVLNNTLCVNSNAPSGNYLYTITGSGTSGAFTLSNNAHEIPLTVTWNGADIAQNSQSAAANTTSMGQDCSGLSSINLEITMLAQHMQSAYTGSYVGNVTVMVEPE